MAVTSVIVGARIARADGLMPSWPEMEEFMTAIIRNSVREKLAAGGVVASITARLVRGVEIAAIAKAAGFDTLYVDLEHNSFSLETTSQICIAALAEGIAPFVRVPAIAPEYIARVLDGGALGIIAPHIRNADDARAAVAYAKYPPLGERSYGGNMPHLGYRSMPPVESMAALNDATMVIVMVETEDALENVEAIIGVAGVDMLLIGTNDLCGEFGIPGQYEHPKVRDAYRRCIEAARAAGKHVGVGGLATRPKLVEQFVQMGARYVSTGADLGFLLAAAAEKAQAVKDIRI
jgi:4-hydroxy-2-oxoheptanedioate aldolase